MIMKRRQIVEMVCIFILCLTTLCGCAGNLSKSGIVIKSSSMCGDSQRDIELNKGETQLSLKGKIQFSEGEVEVYILGKDTNEILYSKKYTTNDVGDISIEVDDLKGNLNLALGLNADQITNFKLSLNSEQKLKKDIQKPETPTAPKH